MAGYFKISKFKDVRNSLKKHAWKRYTNVGIHRKTHIIIHHSLTRRGLGGSNAEAFARYHVDSLGWCGIGYHYVIEPDGTIKFANDIELRTYHVGNHNDYCVGICLTGDFRYEDPTAKQEESLRNLVKALQKEYPRLSTIKGHNELKGYEWKQCPEFDFRAVLAAKPKKEHKPTPSGDIPNSYRIQEGDTFYSIARGIDGIDVDDLKRLNPKVDPKALKVGSYITIRKADEPKPTGSDVAIGKRVESKVDGLRYYIRPSWQDKDVVGTLKEGVGFPTVLSKVKVDSAYQYKVKNSRGDIYYVTAADKYVKIVGTAKSTSKPKSTTSKTSWNLPNTVLKRGSKGNDVKQVQKALNALNFKCGAADGIYGAATEDAVRRFQSMYAALKDDGIYGPQTRAKMLEKLK